MVLYGYIEKLPLILLLLLLLLLFFFSCLTRASFSGYERRMWDKSDPFNERPPKMSVVEWGIDYLHNGCCTVCGRQRAMHRNPSKGIHGTTETERGREIGRKCPRRRRRTKDEKGSYKLTTLKINYRTTLALPSIPPPPPSNHTLALHSTCPPFTYTDI